MLGCRAGVGKTTLVEPRRRQSGPALRRIPGHGLSEGIGCLLRPTLGPEYLAQLLIVAGPGTARAAEQANRCSAPGDRRLRMPCRGTLSADPLIRGVADRRQLRW